MGKSLSTLAKQLRKNHGFHLIPTFDSGVVPGAILHRDSWNKIARVGHVNDSPPVAEALSGEEEGPAPCLLADFNRTHELSVDGSLELINPTTAKARAEFKKAKEAVATFGSPVIYSRSVMLLERAIEAPGSEFWDSPMGQALSDRKTHLVFQVVRARLTFLFRGSGSFGMGLESGPLGDLSKAGLNAGWSWRNEATLESKKEIVVGACLARYVKSKKRLMPG